MLLEDERGCRSHTLWLTTTSTWGECTQQTSCFHTMASAIVRLDGRRAFFLLDMAAVNSYVLYTVQHPDKRRRLTHEQYRIQLATDLLTAAGVSTTSHGRRSVSSHPVARLTEHHFLTTIERNESGQPIQQDCTVCSWRQGRGRNTTTYKCRECDLPMCVVPCFELHHTKRDPQRHLLHSREM